MFSLRGKALLRYALNNKDYGGFTLGGCIDRNHFVSYDNLGKEIAKFLNDGNMLVAINNYRKSKGL